MDSAPCEIVAHIASYLDVKTLFAFVFCKKDWQHALTHEHVFRSGAAAGGHASKTIDIMYQQCVHRRSVYLPTPIRLLRLVNGRRCEKPGCNRKTNHVRIPSGLFLCWQCFCDGNMRVFQADPLLAGHHRYLATQYYGNTCYIIKHPFKCTSGEPAGPVLSILQLIMRQHMPQSLGHNNPSYVVTDQRTPEMIEGNLRKLLRAKLEGRVWRLRRSNEKEIRLHNRRQNKLRKCNQLVLKLKRLAAPNVTALSRLRFKHRRVFSSHDAPLAYDGPVQFKTHMDSIMFAPSRCTTRRLRQLVDLLKDTTSVV